MNWWPYLNRDEERKQRMARIEEHTYCLNHRFKQLDMWRRAEKWCKRKRRKALKNDS